VIESVQPNAGHVALAQLEQRVPKLTLVTQNVDRLHQRAGSTNVVELHGNLIENRCNTCWWIDDAHNHRTDCVRCGGVMRPNVVWFGEFLPEDALRAAQEAARSCDVFLCIGTSAEVYPAAQLPVDARHHGAYVVEVNPNETGITLFAHSSLRGTSASVLPQLIEQLPLSH
jgi:NAD-dependent deacetylase